MLKRVKAKSITFISLLLVIIISCSTLLPISAVESTETDTGLEIQSGAATRLSDPTGIRFSASITVQKYMKIISNKAYKDGYQVGMIIVPKAYVDDFEAQEDVTDYYDYFANTKEKLVDLKFDANLIRLDLDTGTYSFYGSIVNIKEENRELDFQAVAYIAHTVDGVTTYEYSDVSDAENITCVATETIEDIETAEEDVRKLCANYALTYSTVTVSAEDSEYKLRMVGDVTLQDVSDAMLKKYEKMIDSFVGKEMTETLSGTATGNDVSLIGIKSICVIFKYPDGTQEEIKVIPGVGLEHEQTYSSVFAIPDYTGDFKDLTDDLTVTYSYKNSIYAARYPVTTGENSCTFGEGLCSIHLNTDFTEYKSFTVSATRGSTAGGFFLEDQNDNKLWIAFRTAGGLVKVYDSYASNSPNAHDTDYTVPLTAGSDISLTYDGSDLWLSGGEGVGAKAYKLTEFLADNGYTIDLTKIKSAGLWSWGWNAEYTDVTVSGVLLTECEKGNHTDSDGDNVCDLCETVLE